MARWEQTGLLPEGCGRHRRPDRRTDGTDQANIALSSITGWKSSGKTGDLRPAARSTPLCSMRCRDHTGPITNADKAVDTPTTLYQNADLPPGLSTRLASIDAAMDSNSTDYYYCPGHRRESTTSPPRWLSTTRSSTAAPMQDKQRQLPELLAPAGDMERLKMAVLYGADTGGIWRVPTLGCGPLREL